VESQEEEELRLTFNWFPACMSNIKKDFYSNAPLAAPLDPIHSGRPEVELLMYAIPHHQERIRTIVGSSNEIQQYGCTPTIHGVACPVFNILAVITIIIIIL
jgi:hypothetical protein